MRSTALNLIRPSALASLLILVGTNLPSSAQSVGSKQLWNKFGQKFTPEVEVAFLAENKAAAFKKLAAAGKTLPPDFLAWVDFEPTVRTTVYGSGRDAAAILQNLRSLEIDLGQSTVRQKYTQLALAMAFVHAKDGDQANLAPRPPLVLQIGGDPRVLVDTHPKDRPLDRDDHIVNFLIDHAPVMEEVVVGWKEPVPELKYDAKGVAIPQPKVKPKKEAIKEIRPRPLRAADVFADENLEKEFNGYMKAHGQDVQIHCGGPDGKRLNWKSTSAAGIDAKGNMAAYNLFLSAYQAKGYFPKARDAAPTPAERCAFLIRNYEHVFSPQEMKEKKITWPQYPLTSPWPVMAMLAQDAQPLREKEDMWVRYRDKGEFHGYGEYVGDIAQGAFLQVRRLAPYPYAYGTFQMMLKDGGVCGTMANIAVRDFLSLGVPASTGGQPGHCAFIRFAYDATKKTYACVGGQYVTAGDGGTGCHTPWTFGDVETRRNMVYHQSLAWSVNYGFQDQLDSMAAHAFYKQLPDAERKAGASALLTDAVARSPYNVLLVDDAVAGLTEPVDLCRFWNAQKAALTAAAAKPGCPADGLFNQTVKGLIFTRLAALPAPADRTLAAKILTFLKEEQCTNQTVIAAYKVAVGGLPALITETQSSFTAHLASVRTDATCATMSDTLLASAQQISDKTQRAQWAQARWEQIQGKEAYFITPRGKFTLRTDVCVATLAKLAGKKPRPETEQLQPLLDTVTARLKTQLAAPRTPQVCTALAGQISGAASTVKDTTQKRLWLESLAKLLEGKEQYEFTGGKKTQTQRDACADTVKKLLVPAV